ncbi:S1 family peptidase [uncultured Microbacterium sp.]|uniref:S1 family peptidase n=1 Tax=uncultured Microbacterium sp. TaxID=191216 RepID=UPI0028DD0474|nr:S1 family peptidase [uncultured Microbacterium sp.]
MTPQRRRVLAGGTTAALLLSAAGALIPGAATAAEDPVAPLSGPAFDTTAQQLLAADGVEAVATNAEGQVVVYATTPETALTGEAASFVNDHSNVVVKQLSAPLSSLAATDVVGGAGYIALDPATPTVGSLCSIGFSAFNAQGDPAVISAGHCTEDGLRTDAYLSLPSNDDAAGGTQPSIVAPLAELTYSQYGGPLNTPGTDNSLTSTDISTWDVINPALTTLPRITDWSTAAQNDLSLQSTAVRAVGSAQVDAPVTKSGRTTGVTAGEVDSVNAWADVDGRFVYGFFTTALSDEGDSGGAVFQGETAVGILSGGGTFTDGTPLMFAADLQNALAQTPGYTVALFLDAPVVTSAAQLGVGGTVTGTGPANTTLVVTPAGGTPFEVAIGAGGAWSFPAPAEVGETSYTAFARSGFSESAVTPFDVQVLPPAPAITSPANGARIVSEVTKIGGTGVAGATVTLSGDVTGDTTVEQDGTWSFPVNLGIDAYSVTAVQEVDGVDSATSTSAFAVIPTAPVVAAPLAGRTYSLAESPAAANGTGIEDASISVVRNGQAVGSTIVTDGAWNVALTAQAGDTVLEVVQTVNGQSNSTVVSYAVAAAPVAGGGAGGAAPGAGAGSGDALAQTGGGDTTPFAALGLGMLLVGAALVTARRLRTRARV